MMARSDFLPCPFCGTGNPAVWKRDDDLWAVKCVNGCTVVIGSYISRSGARKAWNSRPTKVTASTFNDYFCVFYTAGDPASSMPVALFDRAQFMMDFIVALRGYVDLREDNRKNNILTVRQWNDIYQGQKHLLNDRNLLFIAYLLEQGSDAIFKRICEDMHPDVFELFTQEEKDRMEREYHEWNGDPEEFEPGSWCPQGSIWSNWMSEQIFNYLAEKYGVPREQIKVVLSPVKE